MVGGPGRAAAGALETMAGVGVGAGDAWVSAISVGGDGVDEGKRTVATLYCSI